MFTGFLSGFPHEEVSRGCAKAANLASLASTSIKPGAGQKLDKYCLGDNETKWELMESFPVKGTRDLSLT